MRIGIIGLGSIGERHARNLRALYPRATITILTKRSAWRGPSGMQLFSSPKEFYAAGHDVFFITNETHKHADTIIECLKQKPAGIFVEKPLAPNAKDAMRIARALKGSKTVFFVGYCLQFHEPLMRIKAMIARGAIGSVYSMRVSAGQDIRTWRTRNYLATYANTPNSGGAILDLVHELNYPGWMLNDTLAFVTGASGKIARFPLATEDIAESIFVGEKTRAIVSIHVDYLQTPGSRSCEIHGTKGSIHWTEHAQGKDSIIRIDTPRSSKIMRIRAKTDMYQREMRAFMAHVTKGDGCSTLEESLRDMRSAEHIKRAHHL